MNELEADTGRRLLNQIGFAHVWMKDVKLGWYVRILGRRQTEVFRHLRDLRLFLREQASALRS